MSDDEQPVDDLDDDEPFACWCGAIITESDLAPVTGGCAGTGTLHCICGGDQCVCHNHDEVECPGCADCDDGYEFGDDDFDDGGPPP